MMGGNRELFEDRCVLCPRKCLARRTDGESGACGVGVLPRIARAAPHFWEEPCLCGKGGAGAVFFSGCPLRCIFCQNHKISQQERFGHEVTPQNLRRLFDSLIAQGVANIDLVSGTQFLPAICEALEGGVSVPVVLNCNGYERPETIRALKGIVDIFLPDMKYADAALGLALSDAADYPTVCEKAIEAMIETAGLPVFNTEGILTRGVLVRHLILPGLLDNTRGVLDTFAARFKGRALFSLMGQYTPPEQTSLIPPTFPTLKRRLTPREYARMTDYMLALSIDDGYLQDLTSAHREFTPEFDGTGVGE